MPEPQEASLSPRRVLFAAAALACLTPWISPPIALAIGLAIGLTLGNPWPKEMSKATKLLLQASVVGLGFGMNMAAVVRAGTQGIGFTIATIFGTLVAGTLLGRALGIPPRTTHLIASGTAICGGSAIAAVGPVVGATDEEMSVSLGTVFILNAVALFVFPPIGVALGLTQAEFGIWSAVAIHDTSSVVGAAAKYGAEALQVATTVKLTRALWIIPLALGTALVVHRRAAKIAIPWFIVLFFVAAATRTWVENPFGIFDYVVFAARRGLTLTLFLIGAGLSLPKLRAVGVRPMILGVALWVAISVLTLVAVRSLV
ncbi:MAG: putative sulfate exporter family transporter [Thermoanaerobaculia bacterium]|nr:putative sulfate exporter family transporter [Thermoanaerobaculia bacterium]